MAASGVIALTRYAQGSCGRERHTPTRWEGYRSLENRERFVSSSCLAQTKKRLPRGPPLFMRLRRHLIIFWSELKIAQRFNARQYACLFVESHRDGREFLSSLAGLDLHFILKPSVKNAGLFSSLCHRCQRESSIYEMTGLPSFSTERDCFHKSQPESEPTEPTEGPVDPPRTSTP